MERGGTAVVGAMCCVRVLRDACAHSLGSGIGRAVIGRLKDTLGHTNHPKIHEQACELVPAKKNLQRPRMGVRK